MSPAEIVAWLEDESREFQREGDAMDEAGDIEDRDFYWGHAERFRIAARYVFHVEEMIRLGIIKEGEPIGPLAPPPASEVEP